MADESHQIGQDEIEQLLRQAQRTGGQAAKPAGEPQAAGAAPDLGGEAGGMLDQGAIEQLLQGGGAPSMTAAAGGSWTGSGAPQQAIGHLILPVSMKGWLVILPYALLVPLLLVRDQVHLWFLRRSGLTHQLRRRFSSA